MKINIDQEKLCEFCKDYHNNQSIGDTCEGSFCEKMREYYLDDYGIIDESDTFRQLSPGDYLYMINIDSLSKMKVESILQKESSIVINFDISSITVEVKPNDKESIDPGKLLKMFISKDEAIKNYEASITKKLREMTHNLIKIQTA